MCVSVCERGQLPFTIYPAGFFSPLGRWLGMQDISIGDARFDEHFVIKGNNEAKVQSFDDESLKALLYAQSSLLSKVKDDEGWLGSRSHLVN